MGNCTFNGSEFFTVQDTLRPLSNVGDLPVTSPCGDFARAPITITVVESAYQRAEKIKDEERRVAIKKVAQSQSLRVNSGRSYGGSVEIVDKGRPEYYNCVAYVRSIRSMPRTANGNAGTTPINSREPAVGAIAVMPGHVAIVESATAATVTIVEGNYYKGYKTRRTIPRSEIRGYYR